MTMSKSMRSIEPELIHVAVAIVINSEGKILISRRPVGVHLEGLWEFPGGKLEQDETVFAALHRELTEETVFAALHRELTEETGIQLESGRQLIKIIHKYPEKTVILDTWLIKDWSGFAKGSEGQEIRWAGLNELQDYDFPEADLAIFSALNLPAVYQISPEPEHDLEAFLSKVEICLENGTRLFQLRAKMLPEPKVEQLAQAVNQLCEKSQARWLLNGDPKDVTRLKANGVHLSSERLLALTARPLTNEFLVGASCHNPEELAHAVRIGVDFVVLSVIKKTPSHPDIEPLGWDKFENMIERTNLPVYALGGMSQDDLELAWNHGAQGVAMIRAGWSGEV